MTCLVREIKPLKKPQADRALQLLQRIVSQVTPIMRKRGWSVGVLAEFFPNNPNLLGTNINRGSRINIRLRHSHDQSAFLEYDDLLGTMLHELAHIVRGPHDAAFYKLLDELNDELDSLILQGSSGTASSYKSYRLRESNGLSSSSISRPQLTGTSYRLGGSRYFSDLMKILTPQEMVRLVVQMRENDQKSCGDSESDASTSVEITTPPTPNPQTTIEVIDLTQDDDDQVAPQWICSQCTFRNPPLYLVCEMCLVDRPLYPELHS